MVSRRGGAQPDTTKVALSVTHFAYIDSDVDFDKVTRTQLQKQPF